MTNNSFKLLSVFSVALLTIAMSDSVFADSPSTNTNIAAKINSANQLVRDGQIEQALGVYAEVEADNDHGSHLDYNLAVAHYRNGDIDAAENLFAKVANSCEESVASNSRYNLGNCCYARALHVAEQDKPLAIEHLNDAISHYRGSLRQNPNRTDARANIELAVQLIQKLQQQEEQEQEQQQQSDQNKKEDNQQNQPDQQQDNQQQDGQQQDGQQQDGQQQDDQQQDGQQQDGQQQDDQQQDGQQQDGQQQDDQQQDDQQQDGQQQDGQQQDGQQQDGQQQDGQQQDGQQQDGQQQDGQQQDGQQQDGQQQDGQQQDDQQQDDQQQEGQQQEGQQQEGQQQDGQEQDGQQQDGQEQEGQPVPTGELTAAGSQDENDKPDGAVSMADPDMKDGLMTKEEAMKMLQSVRDRDMLRRLQQQQRERSRHVPVDRDW